MNNNIKIRISTLDDADILVEQHVLMFQEIYVDSIDYNEVDWNRLKESYLEKLKEQIPKDKCAAYLIDFNNVVCASGVVSFTEGIPVPFDPNRIIGYIHSVYTYPEFRGRGYATMIMNKLIEICRKKDIKRINLASSNMGERLYKNLGFKENNGLTLKV